MSFLTFDEWYEKKHGISFENHWMKGHMQINHAMAALARALRDYTSEMMKNLAEKSNGHLL